MDLGAVGAERGQAVPVSDLDNRISRREWPSHTITVTPNRLSATGSSDFWFKNETRMKPPLGL
jgi:hypothetical protein